MSNALIGRLYRDFGAMFGGFVFRGLSVVLGFAITYYVGHVFGATSSGYYALITQSGMLFSIVVLGGMDFSVVKEFSAARANKVKVSRTSLSRLLLFIFLSNGVFILAFMQLPPAWAHKLTALSTGAIEIAMIAVIMVCRSLTRLTGAFLRSQGALKMGQMVEVIFIPAMVIVVAPFWHFRTVQDVLQATIVAGIVSALIGVVMGYRLTASGSDTLGVTVRRLVSEGLPLWGLGVSLNLADWYSVAVVSGVDGLDAAGIFRLSMQVGTTLMFGVTGVMSVVSAQVARAYHARDYEEIGRLNRKAATLNMAVAALPVIILLTLAPYFLNLVGPEFVEGTSSLRILLVGQLFYALFTPAAQTLAMMGHSRLNLIIVVISTVAYLALSPVLAHAMGMFGVALAMVVFLVGRSAACAYYLYVREGINSITGHVRHAQ